MRRSCAPAPVTSCRKKFPSSSPTRSPTSPRARTGRDPMTSTTTKTTFETTAEDAGLRLDQILPRHVPGLSRRKARAVIDLGGVYVDRTRVKVAGRTLRAWQKIEVVIGSVLERVKEARPVPTFEVVHSDDAIIVVN